MNVWTSWPCSVIISTRHIQKRTGHLSEPGSSLGFFLGSCNSRKFFQATVLPHLHCLLFGVKGWVSVQHFVTSADVKKSFINTFAWLVDRCSGLCLCETSCDWLVTGCRNDLCLCAVRELECWGWANLDRILCVLVLASDHRELLWLHHQHSIFTPYLGPASG
jgi:hypothetical protein